MCWLLQTATLFFLQLNEEQASSEDPEINLEVSYLSAKSGKLAGRQMFQSGCEISPP